MDKQQINKKPLSASVDDDQDGKVSRDEYNTHWTKFETKFILKQTLEDTHEEL